MVFDLHGAPATFQKLMDCLLQETVDDVVLYSRHGEDHLNWVASVLQILQEADLTTNSRKAVSCHPI